MRKIYALAPFALAAASFAAQTSESGTVTADLPGMAKLATDLTNASTDISGVVGPAAILIPLSVGAIVIGRGIIKKFFKA